MDIPTASIAAFRILLSKMKIGQLFSGSKITSEGRAKYRIDCERKFAVEQAKIYVDDIKKGKKTFDIETGKFLSNEPKSLMITTGENEKSLQRVEPIIDFQFLHEEFIQSEIENKIRQEINIGQAIYFAEEELLNDDRTYVENEIEEDWLRSWADYAKTFSTEDLQLLWGKILAGEFKSPGSYSRRTLDFLKSISKDEAEKIEKIAPFVTRSHLINFGDLLAKHGISFPLLLEMQELGLLSGVGGSLELTTASDLLEKFESHIKNLSGKTKSDKINLFLNDGVSDYGVSK